MPEETTIKRELTAKHPAVSGTVPRITEQELLNLLEGYFLSCDKEKRAYNAIAMSKACGLSFEEFKDGTRFIQSSYIRDIQKRALSMCESDAAQRLIEGKPPIGLIFYLKNAFNWKDKREEERTFNIRVERIRYNKKKTGPKRKQVQSIDIPQ